MKTPLVTVLTTTYNHSKFIADCIGSVLAQTYDNWEQVIVDDGSTDGTEEIVNEFDDEKIVYVRQKHVGVHRLSETYNRGLKLAKGDFIAILEGDDLYPKRKLELQIDSLADDAILSFGKCVIIDQDKKYLGTIPWNFKQYMSMTNWLRPLLVYDYIPGLTVMVKKEALIKVGGFTQPANTVAVDYSTYLELALVGRFRFVDEVLGVWRRHGGSYSDSVLYNSMNPLISDVALQYVIPFCQKHGFVVDWKALAEQKGRDLFHVGRHQLLHGNRREALQNFKQSFKLSSVFGKFKSLGGITVSIIGLDFEKIARKLGRPTER
jgi:glycosyltransferase involved in cell wall biosynthesis